MVRFKPVAALAALAALALQFSTPVFAQTPLPGYAGITGPGAAPPGGGPVPAFQIQNALDVFVVGNYAYVTAQDEFFVVDITIPQTPIVLGSLSHGSGGASLQQPIGVFVAGNYAYVAAQANNALEVINITDPNNPVHAGKLLNNGGGGSGAELNFVHDVEVMGNIAFAVGQNTMEIANVSNPASITHVADISTNGANAIDVVDTDADGDADLAYVTGFNSFSIIDVSNPAAPAVLSMIMDGQGGGAQLSFSETVQVVGNYAYLAAGQHNALEVLNISNPAAPVHAGSIANGEDGAIIQDPKSVFVSGNYAYVMDGDSPNTIEIVDITDPTDPQHVIAANSQTAGLQLINAQRLFVSGNFMYVATVAGMEVDYIFDPTPPSPSGQSSSTLTSFTLHWSAAPLLTNFLLDVSANNNFSSFLPGLENLSVPASTPSKDVSGLTSGTTYYYRLKAVNANGTSGYSTTGFAYTVPGALSPQVTAVTADSFTISWSPIPSGGSYRYQYLQELGPLPNYEPYFETSGTSATANFVLAGTRYYFGVKAQNNAGIGELSIVEVTTLPLPPTIGAPINAEMTKSSIKVNWIAVPGSATHFLDIATDAGFTSFVPGYENRSAPGNSLTSESILTPNTAYYVRMRAANAAGGLSVNSPTTSYLTLPEATTAGAPTMVTINSFRANWTEVPGATLYNMDVSTLPTFDTKLDNYNNRQVSVPNSGVIVDTGLSPGTTYYYRVRVTNATGPSPDYSNVITAVTLPVAPTLGDAQSVTLTTFTASWSAPPGATGYFLDVATNDTFTNFVTGFENKSVGNVTSALVDGLTSSTSYHFRVRAANAGGPSSNSATKLVITAAPAPIATIPTNVGQTSFTANWNSVSGVTDYRIDVSSDNAFVSNVVVNNVLVAGATTLAVTGLNAGTTYHYRVRAVNQTAASANSNVISQITIPPNPMTNAAEPEQTSFTAKWTAAAGASEYFVDVRDDVGATVTGYDNVSVTSGTSLVVSTGIAAGTNYTYIVRAKNSAGTSGSSTPQPVLTKPPTPVALEAEISGTISFVAKWNSAKSATKYFINVSTVSTFASSVPGYSNFDVGSGQQTTVTVNAPATGATYYYQVSAQNSSGTSPFSAAITVNTPAVSFDPINLPTGGSVNSYGIISIPDGTTASSALSSESRTKTWRLMHYDNAAGKNIDLESFSQMQSGKGYWVNSNLDEAPTITLAGQATASAKTLSLAQGWNQIGNPFNFGISWSDVKAKNPGASGVGDLWVYNNGFSKNDALKGYGGGFVFAQAAMQLTIPANVNRASRTASPRHEIEGRDIAEDAWFLPLTFESDGKVNDHAGFGMHPSALNTIDALDEVALPRLFNLSDISTYHPEFFSPRFMIDVVKATEAYSWTFNVSSEESEARLSWDNSEWSAPGLYLIDDAAGVLLDMSKASFYRFDPRRSGAIKFAFGRNGKFTTEITNFGQPFPNPSSDRVTFPFIATIGERVGITVLDLTGRTVGTMNVMGNAGFNEATWDATENKLAPGVYLYQITTSNGIRKTGRIVLK